MWNIRFQPSIKTNHWLWDREKNGADRYPTHAISAPNQPRNTRSMEDSVGTGPHICMGQVRMGQHTKVATQIEY
jgi:hypothetical protein